MNGDQVVDLEEAVGSYLNCLSTSCAAGSKLYTSVGKLIDDKFQELFPGKEPRLYFQALQTQNAFEGYQKALLECKDKLLEILIDNHTKKQPSKEKGKGKTKSPEEQYAGVALRVAKELYCYHQTVADVLKPLHFSDCQEDVENTTLMNIDGKSDVVTAWMTIVEANKLLRTGYGLSNSEVSQILSWQHGEDMTESTRKRLNHQVNTYVQKYVDRMFSNAICEVDIPVAFNMYPSDIQRILQNCCNPTECLGASAQGFLTQKEEITTLLHRELPRVCLMVNGKKFEKAHPGKAYENATHKMRAIREAVSHVLDAKKIDISKEQMDMLCLRLLSIASISTANAACRTAVVLTFGKVNLVQVTPIVDQEKLIHFEITKDEIDIRIFTKWAIIEDPALFTSLCRNNSHPIATVHVSYHASINVDKFFMQRMDPIPIARITQCILQQAPSNHGGKKELGGRERSKSIKIKLTKATNRFFQRKGGTSKAELEADIIANEFAGKDQSDVSSKTPSENGYNSTSDSQDDAQPVPPPRHKRKAKKTKKSAAKEKKPVEEKKEDLGWFSSSSKFGIPLVAAVSGAKDQSPSVASFEELQGVIDFLSGSSTSSLAINEKGEKLRHTALTHKRNNSTTSLPHSTDAVSSKSKTNSEGKLKLCHKKSASFSGDVDTNKCDSTDSALDKLKKDSKTAVRLNVNTDKNKPTSPSSSREIPNSSNSNVIKSNNHPKPPGENTNTSNKNKKREEEDTTSTTKAKTKNNTVSTDTTTSPDLSDFRAERTPGDGMDNKINKDIYTSNTSIVKSNSSDSKNTTNTVNIPVTKKQLEESKDKTSSARHAKVRRSSAQKKEPIENEKTEKIVLGDFNQLQQPPKKQQHPVQQAHQPQQPQQQQSILLQKVSANNRITLDSIPATRVPLTNDVTSKEENSHLSITSNNVHSNLQLTTTPVSVYEASLDTASHHLGNIDVAETPGLYDPFNSKTTGWTLDVGVQSGGGSRFKSMWSDATLDGDKKPPADVDRNPSVSPAPSITSSSTFSSSSRETLDLSTAMVGDRQQDLNVLTIGDSSKILGTNNGISESWKDIPHYQTSQPSDFPQQFQTPSSTIESQQAHDPWPLQSSNHGNRNYHVGHNYGQLGGHHHHNSHNNFHSSRSNIENLHLTPNPVGPYMRQNREQLLAKQQILENYARQQKQLQLQQQQQPQPQQPQPFQTKIGGQSMRAPSRPSSNHSFLPGNMERVSSLPPPGLGNQGNSKYDFSSVNPERHSFRSNLQQSHHHHQHQQQRDSHPFGGLSTGNISQTRSVGDIRMENTGFHAFGHSQDPFSSGMNGRGGNVGGSYREFNPLHQADPFTNKY